MLINKEPSLYTYQTGKIGKLDNAKCWRVLGYGNFCVLLMRGVQLFWEGPVST